MAKLGSGLPGNNGGKRHSKQERELGNLLNYLASNGYGTGSSQSAWDSMEAGDEVKYSSIDEIWDGIAEYDGAYSRIRDGSKGRAADKTVYTMVKGSKKVVAEEPVYDTPEKAEPIYDTPEGVMSNGRSSASQVSQEPVYGDIIRQPLGSTAAERAMICDTVYDVHAKEMGGLAQNKDKAKGKRKPDKGSKSKEDQGKTIRAEKAAERKQDSGGILSKIFGNKKHAKKREDGSNIEDKRLDSKSRSGKHSQCAKREIVHTHLSGLDIGNPEIIGGSVARISDDTHSQREKSEVAHSRLGKLEGRKHIEPKGARAPGDDMRSWNKKLRIVHTHLEDLGAAKVNENFYENFGSRTQVGARAIGEDLGSLHKKLYISHPHFAESASGLKGVENHGANVKPGTLGSASATPTPSEGIAAQQRTAAPRGR